MNIQFTTYPSAQVGQQPPAPNEKSQLPLPGNPGAVITSKLASQMSALVVRNNHRNNIWTGIQRASDRMDKISEQLMKCERAIRNFDADHLLKHVKKLVALNVKFNNGEGNMADDGILPGIITDGDGRMTDGNLLDIFIIALKNNPQAWENRKEAVKKTLNVILEKIDPYHVTWRGDLESSRPLLHRILGQYDLPVARELIKAIFEYEKRPVPASALNLKDGYGNTAAHLAARRSDIELLRFLKKYGADFSIKNNDGKTVLDVLNEAISKIVT